MSAVVRLRPGKEKPLLGHHPWVFSGAIASVKGNPSPGDIVTVVAGDGRFLARGYWNGASQIRVRVLTFRDVEVDEGFWQQALARSVGARGGVVGRGASASLRTTDGGGPSASLGTMEGVRLVYGESDYLPGLIVDRYADYLVLQALTFGMDQRKWMIAEILEDLVGSSGIYERSDADVRDREELPPSTGVLRGNAP
ncbi:MAG: hypothetical protein KDI19_11300, partial [Pseudomonadales bacterium]|nr:hypothetical protein [Pseudomonadales bacterium]